MVKWEEVKIYFWIGEGRGEVKRGHGGGKCAGSLCPDKAELWSPHWRLQGCPNAGGILEAARDPQN